MVLGKVETYNNETVWTEDFWLKSNRLKTNSNGVAFKEFFFYNLINSFYSALLVGKAQIHYTHYERSKVRLERNIRQLQHK